MHIVSITRLRLRSHWFFPAFVWHTVAANRQAKHAEGNLGVNLRRSNGAYWTLTMWRDVADMRAFILSGSHRTAMPHLVNWCDEAATVRFDWASDKMPSWNEAESQMGTNGKISPVKHPSPAHAAGLTLGEQQNYVNDVAVISSTTQTRDT